MSKAVVRSTSNLSVQEQECESMKVKHDMVRSLNWQGSIPVVIRLADTSLSSPTAPAALHRMISRQTYLHVGLSDCIDRFSRYALVVGGGTDDTNATWFEDEDTNTPLKWHRFAGVLHDALVQPRTALRREQASSSSSCVLPWKLRLHFTSYPTTVLLPLDHTGGATDASASPAANTPTTSAATSATASTTAASHDSLNATSSMDMESAQNAIDSNDDVEDDDTQTARQRVQAGIQAARHYFFNSLKQALFLQRNSSRVSSSELTKKRHTQLWDALLNTNCQLYLQVNQHLQHAANSKDCPPQTVLANSYPNPPPAATGPTMLHHVPIRIVLDNRPPLQKPFTPFRTRTVQTHERTGEAMEPTTLGHVFLHCLPQLFHHQQLSPQSPSPPLHPDDDNFADIRDAATATEKVIPNPHQPCSYLVQGVVPPLSCPIVDLWQSMCHPDHFLYVIVSTTPAD